MSAIRRDYLAALFVLLVPVLTTLHAAETVTEPEHASSDFARLTLPTTIYAVPGVETSLYFANAILAAPTAEFSFTVGASIYAWLKSRLAARDDKRSSD